MKIRYILIGVIIIIGSIFLIADDVERYEIQKKGDIVKMKIIEIPDACLGTKNKHFMQLNYEDLIIVKQIGPSTCDDYNIGDTVEMKFLPKYNEALWPKENVIHEFIAGGFVILVGFSIILKGLKVI